MLLFDTAVMAGLRWIARTLETAARAEYLDDSALRAQLLDVEMRADAGLITEEERARLEGELLAAIHEVKQRRGPAAGPLDFTAPDGGFEVDAAVAGNFHEAAAQGGHP
jgi:hypothetical protein